MNETLDSTRDRLLDAAGEIFAEKGFEATTVREICGRIGVNIAAVNYHFGDKQGLYWEAVKKANCSGEENPADFAAVLALPAEGKLHEFVRAMLMNLLDPTRPDWHAKLMMREVTSPTKACADLVDAYIRPKAEFLGAILTELLTDRVEEAERILFAFSVVGQCLFYRVQRHIAILLIGEEQFNSYSIERLTDHITEVTLAAVRARRAGRLHSEGVRP
jgi:AcrR family transcriptional regulator